MSPLLADLDGAEIVSSLVVDTGWCAMLCMREVQQKMAKQLRGSDRGSGRAKAREGERVEDGKNGEGKVWWGQKRGI